MTRVLKDSDFVLRAYCQLGMRGLRRGITPTTVGLVLEAAIAHRGASREVIFVGVIVPDEDGIRVRRAARLEPGETRAAWRITG